MKAFTTSGCMWVHCDKIYSPGETWTNPFHEGLFHGSLRNGIVWISPRDYIFDNKHLLNIGFVNILHRNPCHLKCHFTFNTNKTLKLNHTWLKFLKPLLNNGLLHEDMNLVCCDTTLLHWDKKGGNNTAKGLILINIGLADQIFWSIAAIKPRQNNGWRSGLYTSFLKGQGHQGISAW